MLINTNGYYRALNDDLTYKSDAIMPENDAYTSDLKDFEVRVSFNMYGSSYIFKHFLVRQGNNFDGFSKPDVFVGLLKYREKNLRH